jgi:signal peptidase I
MSGSGSRDGSGSPPWDSAEPVPELEETQTLPGLGAHSGQAGTAGRASGSARHGAANGGGPRHSGATQGARRQEDAAGYRRSEQSGQSGQSAQSERSGQPGQGSGTSGPQTADTDDANGGDGGDDTSKPGDARPGRKRRRRRSALFELLVLGVIAVALALVIKTYAIQAFFIPSGSMENTLEIGDRVLINKLVYDFRGIHRGDIIVFDGNGSWDFNPPASSNIFSRFVNDLEGIVGISHDSSIYIKRVIGLPGDHVACCNAHGQVTVNGVALSEQSYLYPGNVPSTQPFKITVPPGRLWVMGDHRAVSYDSRGHMGDPGGGTIPESAVLGRAFVIIWPPSRWSILNIPATFQQPQLNASAAAAGGSSSSLAAAMDNGTPIRESASVLPLALGFAGAVPLTWLQRRARRRLFARRKRRRAAQR